MDQRADGVRLQEGTQFITALAAHDILVIRMGHAAVRTGNRYRYARERDVIDAGQLPAPCVFLVQVRELDAQDRRLDLIQPGIQTWYVADIALSPPVFPKQACALRQVSVVGDHSAPVPQRSQVLCRIETKCGEMPPGARLPAVDGGSVGLRAIFNDLQAVALGNAHDRGHIGRMSVEMDRQDRFEPTGALLLY